MISSIQASSAGNAAALRAATARPAGGDRDAAQGDPDHDAGKATASAPPLSGTAGGAAAANVLTLNADSDRDNDNDRGGGAQPAAVTSAYAKAASSGAVKG